MNGRDQINIAKMIRQAASANSEKRSSFRLSLRLPMDFSLPESPDHHLAYMVDLCEEGLLMHTAEKMELGQNLKIQFYYDSAAGLDRIQAHGEVIRVDRLRQGGKEYSCAVKFSRLSTATLNKLRKFLKSLY